MRNKYPGPCYKCGKEVKPGKGHFERHKGEWLLQHAEHAKMVNDDPITSSERE